MSEILIFGSEDCPSWEQTQRVRKQLERDEEVTLPVKILDPGEHEEQFREHGLTICPSMVVGDEVISVGPPRFETVKKKILVRTQSGEDE